jgi:hypothetical protein
VADILRFSRPEQACRSLIAAALMLAAPAHAQGKVGDPEITFHGGLFDGLVIGDVVRPDNHLRMRGLKISVPGSSPLGPDAKAAVAGFVRAYEKGSNRFAPFATADAVSIWCEDLAHCGQPLKLRRLPFGEKCVANVPYLTPDGQVRIEWSYKGMLYYVSWLKLRGGKISEVRTYRAEIPHLLIRPVAEAA